MFYKFLEMYTLLSLLFIYVWFVRGWVGSVSILTLTYVSQLSLIPVWGRNFCPGRLTDPPSFQANRHWVLLAWE
jgi:hypothetical protein